MPKRARSKRPAPDAIISIEQQASPNVAGHIEPARAEAGDLLDRREQDAAREALLESHA